MGQGATARWAGNAVGAGRFRGGQATAAATSVRATAAVERGHAWEIGRRTDRWVPRKQGLELQARLELGLKLSRYLLQAGLQNEI
jgi:hypothetical protein